ncbi:hypothetical protein HDV01_004529 [Terramyces sp. JEL0728]|nr:hypothetical protein HDV01_004529 [Terramyces sp. JEL0728]
MPKQPKTCITCAAKKRKCDRKRPCSRCSTSGFGCIYPGDPIKHPPTIPKTIPKIIPGNESVFTTHASQSPELTSDDMEYSETIEGNTITMDAESLSILNKMLDAMEIFMKLSRRFLEKCCQSLLMRLATRTFYYVLNVDPHNRQIWSEKSVYEFSVQLKNPSLPNLLGAAVLSLSFIKSGDFRIGIPYFSFVINMAKLMGINKETGLAKLTKDPQEKEDCRNLWWVIYRVDQFMTVLTKGIISEEDNGIYLPGTASQSHNDDVRSLGLEIMTSKTCFTPSMFSANIYVNKLLLDRLMGQAVRVHEKFKSDQSIDTIFALVNLQDSLYLWHFNLPRVFENEMKLLDGIGSVNRSITWVILDAYLEYYFAMIVVKCPLVYSNLSSDYATTIKSKAFASLCSDAVQLTRILKFFIKNNPSFEYSTLFYINYAFQALVPQLLCKLTDQTPVILQTLQVLPKKFQIGTSVYNLANYLICSDELVILQEYSRFSFVDHLQHEDGDTLFEEFLNDDILVD